VVNNTQQRYHKHCVPSNDDDEPQNNYYTTRCTGVPHPHGPVYKDSYVFPFCFAASETVQLQDPTSPDGFRIVQLTEVAVGDRILSSKNMRGTELSYSEILAVPHADNQISANFFYFRSQGGNDIKMMSKHVITVVENCAGTPNERTVLKLAEDVKITDCLIVASAGLSNSSVGLIDPITEIDYITGKGIYTVVTVNEFVVVNGIIASPFAGNHAAANAFYNIHRLLFSTVPWLLDLNVVKRANEIFGMLIVLVCRLS
jgi:hypothetical protein